jgi:hypothetical protein
MNCPDDSLAFPGPLSCIEIHKRKKLLSPGDLSVKIRFSLGEVRIFMRTC